MYALVNGSELILGPINFNIKMINSELEDLGLTYRVNSQDYLNVPIQITENIKILDCIENIPQYDSRKEQIFQLGWEIINNTVIFNYEVREKPLEQIKDEFKELIAPIRYSKENSIISLQIESETIQISTDRETRSSLASKLLSSDGPYNFKFNRDTWIEITKIDLQFILSEIDNFVQSVFDWEYQKIQETDACITPEEIFAIDLS